METLFPSDSSDSVAFLLPLAEHTSFIIFAFDPDQGRFAYLNPAFESVFERSREPLEPHQLWDMVYPEDRPYVADVYRQLLDKPVPDEPAGGYPGHTPSGEEPPQDNTDPIEFRIQLADQTIKWLRVIPLPVPVQSGRLLAGMAEDITKWKYYLDVETRYSNKKNAILHILSHELAGPLGTIQSLSSLVFTRIQPYEDEDSSRVVNLINQTSKHSLRLIRDFIEQEFLESSEVDLVKARVDLVQKTAEYIGQLQESQQKLPAIRFTSSDPSIYIVIDEVKFHLVVANLVSNAIKFTSDDDGWIAVHIEDQPESSSVLIRVQDNGIGIPQKYHASLFDKFTRARRQGLRNEPTTGLGMSIIKTIVEWHQGKIWFESEENQGTTFFIQIPSYTNP